MSKFNEIVVNNIQKTMRTRWLERFSYHSNHVFFRRVYLFFFFIIRGFSTNTPVDLPTVSFFFYGEHHEQIIIYKNFLPRRNFIDHLGQSVKRKVSSHRTSFVFAKKISTLEKSHRFFAVENLSQLPLSPSFSFPFRSLPLLLFHPGERKRKKAPRVNLFATHISSPRILPSSLTHTVQAFEKFNIVLVARRTMARIWCIEYLLVFFSLLFAIALWL